MAASTETLLLGLHKVRHDVCFLKLGSLSPSYCHMLQMLFFFRCYRTRFGSCLRQSGIVNRMDEQLTIQYSELIKPSISSSSSLPVPRTLVLFFAGVPTASSRCRDQTGPSSPPEERPERCHMLHQSSIDFGTRKFSAALPCSLAVRPQVRIAYFDYCPDGSRTSNSAERRRLGICSQVVCPGELPRLRVNNNRHVHQLLRPEN